MNIGAFFVSHAQSSELVKPRKCALDNPSRGAESTAVVDIAFGENGRDAFFTQGLAMRLGVVSTVGLNAVGALPRSPAFAANGRNSLNQRKKLGYIVSVGTGYREGQRDALRVREYMMFGACFAPIRRIGPRFLPPKTARTDALSATARDQSITSASLSLASSTSSTSSHRPAFCHACRRRQHVMPLPQPISLGKYSQPMPVRKMNRMPVSACRFGTAGRPLLLGGLSGGKIGSMSSQRLSGKIGRAMPRPPCSPMGFGLRHPRCAEHVMENDHRFVNRFC